MSNRNEWEEKGECVVKRLVEKYSSLMDAEEEHVALEKERRSKAS